MVRHHVPSIFPFADDNWKAKHGRDTQQCDDLFGKPRGKVKAWSAEPVEFKPIAKSRSPDPQIITNDKLSVRREFSLPDAGDQRGFGRHNGRPLEALPRIFWLMVMKWGYKLEELEG